MVYREVFVWMGCPKTLTKEVNRMAPIGRNTSMNAMSEANPTATGFIFPSDTGSTRELFPPMMVSPLGCGTSAMARQVTIRILLTSTLRMVSILMVSILCH
jgi:hypothetical protein